MIPPLPVREAREKALLLTLQFIDPIGAFVAGVLTLYDTIPAAQALLHGDRGPRAEIALAVWGLALLVANPLTIFILVMRGFGAPTTLARKLSSQPLVFCLGAVIYAAAHDSAFTSWLDMQIASLHYAGEFAGTFALFGSTAFTFATATRGILHWGHEAARTALNAAGASARNRSQHRALSGELFLCGGIARGLFRDRNLAVGVPQRGDLLLYGEQSARRGTIAVGAPGSSKTRSKLYPDLYWGLHTSPRAGALVFITKRRATEDCYAIASRFRPKDRIHIVGVGPGSAHMDITSRMTHESIGDAIQDGLGSSHSDFWRHGPSAFVEGFVEIAKALAPATIQIPPQNDENGVMAPGGEGYDLEITDTLPTFLKLISLDGRRLDALFSHGFERAAELETRDERKANALRELLHEVKERVLPLMLRDAKLGEELRQSVLPQLQPFARGPLRDAFCDSHGIDLALLEQGHVMLVEIDETEHPRAVGTVVRMIFRRIVQMARERTASDRIGVLDPVILICDEYTNYAAPGHVQAWNTVRESNFCPTVGITSVSALARQLGGDHDATNAIVANFANKFFFEVDDKATRDLARELIGQSVVLRRSNTEGTSRTHGSSSSINSGSNQSRGTSQSESLSEHREDAIDGSVWRALGAGRDYSTAIAFVRTSAGVKTDVVVLGVLDPTEGIITALPDGYGLRSSGWA
jgi:hypothetical protein